MNFSVNNPTVDAYENRSFEPMANGPHVVQITRVQVGHSKGRNCPMLIIRLTDVWPGSNGKPNPDEAKSMIHYIVLDDETWGIGRLIALCRALGVVGAADSPGGLDPADEQSAMDNLLGKVLIGTMSYKETPKRKGNGVFKTNNCDAYNRPKPSTIATLEAHYNGMPPLPDDAHKSMDGTRSLGASKLGVSPQGEEIDVVDQSTFSEDDLPF
jgi:hypothetical protein